MSPLAVYATLLLAASAAPLRLGSTVILELRGDPGRVERAAAVPESALADPHCGVDGIVVLREEPGAALSICGARLLEVTPEDAAWEGRPAGEVAELWAEKLRAGFVAEKSARYSGELLRRAVAGLVCPLLLLSATLLARLGFRRWRRRLLDPPGGARGIRLGPLQYQSKLTLMSESLRNDGRIWVPVKARDKRPPGEIPETERDYYLERKYPSVGNLAPRDMSSRAAKQVCDEGRGVGDIGLGVFLDFSDAIRRLGRRTIAERYGNLFEMYERITDEDPYKVPMRIFPALHYTMGGLWVDYNLMTTIPGLHVLGEANFSDHGANRLGASALMQGLADGYFVIPYTLPHYLASTTSDRSSPISFRLSGLTWFSLFGSNESSRSRTAVQARPDRAHRLLEQAMTPPFAPDRFPHLFDAAPLGIAVIDADGRLTEANPALLALAGRTVGIVLSGANIDRETLGRVLAGEL